MIAGLARIDPAFVGDIFVAYPCGCGEAQLFAEAGKRTWSRHCRCGKVWDIRLHADGAVEWTERRARR